MKQHNNVNDINDEFTLNTSSVSYIKKWEIDQ